MPLILLFSLLSGFNIFADEQIAYTESDLYSSNVQKVFDNRCVACHSCLESPCQLNLQSHEGLMRGLSKTLAYEGNRMHAIEPTRLFIDAQSTEQWQKKGFEPVVSSLEKPAEDSTLFKSLILSKSPTRTLINLPVAESHVCSSNLDQTTPSKNNMANLPISMPYNLAPISDTEISQIRTWLESGQTPPQGQKLNTSKRNFQEQDLPAIASLESLLNSIEHKNRLVARYLYEHLFLADLYFSEELNQQPAFFQLVRSKNPCSVLEVISTRLPNQDPGVVFPFYCIVKNTKTIAAKNHIPYKMDLKKIAWLNENFLGRAWPERLFIPDYKPTTAANPFAAFRSIPIEARYRFLLEDSWYHVMTFIKGPVCNGNNALNSIQNQFYVLFMDPKQDMAIKNNQFGRLLRKVDDLPGTLGSDVAVTTMLAQYKSMHAERKRERVLKNLLTDSTFVNGRGLETIWDGDGKNPNALLTVIRHGDYASVHQGAIGASSKTVFVLDYSVFERIVYNLVVNFDVFGNVGHQALSRMYMDILRMDAENNFLELLPQEERKSVKKSWYKGMLGITSLKLSLINEFNFSKVKSTVNFKTKSYKDELIGKILFERLNEKVRGPIDPLHFNFYTKILDPLQTPKPSDAMDKKISILTTRAAGQNKFARYFPELTYLVLTQGGKPVDFLSVVANKEMDNVSWIFFEDNRRSKAEDSLTLSRDFIGTSPNLIMAVEISDLDYFVRDALSLDSEEDFLEFKAKYRVNPLSENFWPTYDAINMMYKQKDPIRAGVIDLTRYELVDAH